MAGAAGGQQKSAGKNESGGRFEIQGRGIHGVEDKGNWPRPIKGFRS
jgi:hypothetical protein